MVRRVLKRGKKSYRKRRGGINILGLDIPVKSTVSDFVSNNSTIADFAPGLQRLGPDYAPSKLIGDIDVKPYLENYPAFIPVAEEFQQGLVEGLQSHGIGRRRRRGKVVYRKAHKGPKKAHKKKGKKSRK
jgi:hypothetical protein